MPVDSPSDSPVLSVVIPCYRQAKYLATAIDSALIQEDDANRVQVIVVDDGSPDDTAEVAARFGTRIEYIKQPNAGVGVARNNGLSVARGEYVHFLDADDYLLPGMLTAHLEVMRDRRADVTCSGLQWVDPEGKLIKTVPAADFTPDPFHAMLPINLCPPVCYLFKRSLINAVGGFDPDRVKLGHADWDILLRVAATGSRFERVPSVLVSYRLHGESASSRYTGMYDSGRAVLKKIEALHAPCPACGDRFKRAYAIFDDEYMDYLIRPALKGGIFGRKYRPLWRHFLQRSVARPALPVAIARRLITGAFRRAFKSSSTSPS